MAQNVNIAGAVTDPSHSAVVTAQATLASNPTHTGRHAATDWTGAYKFTRHIARHLYVDLRSKITFLDMRMPMSSSARQHEGGIKFLLFHDRIALNTAAFNVARNNVATLVTINGVETIVFDSQRTRGFEASFNRKPTQWHILANVTTQDPLFATMDRTELGAPGTKSEVFP